MTLDVKNNQTYYESIRMSLYLPASSGVFISNSNKFSCFSSISCRMALMVWCYQVRILKTSLQEGRFSLWYVLCSKRTHALFNLNCINVAYSGKKVNLTISWFLKHIYSWKIECKSSNHIKNHFSLTSVKIIGVGGKKQLNTTNLKITYATSSL